MMMLLLFEVAKSGRMKCGECGDRIEKGTVKVRIDSRTCVHLSCADSESVKKVIADMNGQKVKEVIVWRRRRLRRRLKV